MRWRKRWSRVGGGTGAGGGVGRSVGQGRIFRMGYHAFLESEPLLSSENYYAEPTKKVW